MTPDNKKHFTKPQRLSLLVSIQKELIKTNSSLLNRIETKYPESGKQLISDTKKKLSVLNARLSILLSY